ncbi:MAG: ferrochelatase [Rhodospirillales bacterium]|nr:ferrochelatase [Rhodospirillales bacterium]
MSKIAVILFNLGGPDRPESVEPFLFNLFNDPAIIGLPWPLRPLFARLISRRRAPVAREIYDHIGGGSPLLDLTLEQAGALEAGLSRNGDTVRVFVSMRYWYPMSDETALLVKDFEPDEIILLPLYPQYSTTTSASSLKDWRRAAAAAKLSVPAKAICCYPTEEGLIQAQAELVRGGMGEAAGAGNGTRVLFSAHGLPKRVVEKGDPYVWQVEKTARAVIGAVLEATGEKTLDWAVCYQSRVGPLEWIGPSIENELMRASKDGVGVVIVPIAFVSEHSETLVELDIEYRKVAEEMGIAAYVRVPAVGTNPKFIEGLARLVDSTRAGKREICSQTGDRICPGGLSQCPQSFRAVGAKPFSVGGLHL